MMFFSKFDNEDIYVIYCINLIYMFYKFDSDNEF